MDLRKAYDRVNTKKLVEKLEGFPLSPAFYRTLEVLSLSNTPGNQKRSSGDSKVTKLEQLSFCDKAHLFKNVRLSRRIISIPGVEAILASLQTQSGAVLVALSYLSPSACRQSMKDLLEFRCQEPIHAFDDFSAKRSFTCRNRN